MYLRINDSTQFFSPFRFGKKLESFLTPSLVEDLAGGHVVGLPAVVVVPLVVGVDQVAATLAAHAAVLAACCAHKEK